MGWVDQKGYWEEGFIDFIRVSNYGESLQGRIEFGVRIGGREEGRFIVGVFILVGIFKDLGKMLISFQRFIGL